MCMCLLTFSIRGNVEVNIQTGSSMHDCSRVGYLQKMGAGDGGRKFMFFIFIYLFLATQDWGEEPEEGRDSQKDKGTLVTCLSPSTLPSSGISLLVLLGASSKGGIGSHDVNRDFIAELHVEPIVFLHGYINSNNRTAFVCINEMKMVIEGKDFNILLTADGMGNSGKY